MERWQRLTIAALAVVVGGFGSFTLGFTLGQNDAAPDSILPGTAQSQASERIQDAFNSIMSLAVSPPRAKDVARAAIKAMVRALRDGDDPYALYYSPAAYRSFQEFASGKFSGIGVWLKVKNDMLEIVSVLPKTPAAASGLRPGDRIVRVGSKAVNVRKVDNAINAIKGKAGTSVSLLVRRAGTKLTFDIERAEIELPNLQADLTDEGFGHVRLFGFGRQAGDQVHDEVEKLLASGAEGIILDLRDNGGGLFAEAINVASVFIEDGPIVTYKDGSSDDVEYEAEGDAFEDIPLVVLVNEGTASSSEIVAGALQARDRALVVGVRTFGKGTVQEVLPLSDASAFKVTTAAYLLPGGGSIDGLGIKPDFKVDAAPWRQLRKAMEVLQRLVAGAGGATGGAAG